MSTADVRFLSFRVLADEDIQRRSFGKVTAPGEDPTERWELAKGTLHDPRIFGAAADWTCACGLYRGRRHKDHVCHVCGVTVGRASRLRATRFGHIRLGAPVPHPLAPAASVRVIPVLPVRLRDPAKFGVDLNHLYSEVVRLRDDSASSLARRVAELYCNEWLPEPRTSGGRVLRSLLYYLTHAPAPPRWALPEYMTALGLELCADMPAPCV